MTMTESMSSCSRRMRSARPKSSGVAEAMRSMGFASPAAAGRNSPKRGLDLLAQGRHVQPVGFAGVGGEDGRAAGVREDGDVSARRQRLVRQQVGDVEELLQRVHPDDARLPEERVRGHVEAGESAGVRSRRPRAGGAATALQREHRLRRRDATGEPGELARVPERLQVEQDDVGVRVLLPVLDEVVAGDVRLVADADERRKPEVQTRARSRAAPGRGRRSATAARRCPRGGKTGEKVALRLTSGSVLMTPMQFGPSMRMP